VSERGGLEAEEEGGYRTKNKNLTRQCGEKLVFLGLLIHIAISCHTIVTHMIFDDIGHY